MHGFNFSIPHFITHIRGIRIVVTLEMVSDVLHVLRVEHPDYPGCDCLKTVSKDELISTFYEHLSDRGEHQFTSFSGFT